MTGPDLVPSPARLGRHGRWLDADQVAAYLGRSRRAVQQLWNKGLLPFRFVSGERCTSLSDLEKWVESQPGISLEESLANSRGRGGLAVVTRTAEGSTC